LTLGSVEAVNLVNNHTMDYLEIGLTDTMQALDERGIAYFSHFAPTVIEIKGIRIALIGLAFPIRESNVKWMCEQIAAYRADPDIGLIIANFHWGAEYYITQNKEQVQTARRVIDAGADIVVGTHPHVLQGMEVYNGKPIFYSLGNFSFGGDSAPRDLDTALMQLEYDISGETPSLVRLQVFPINMTESSLGTAQDYHPVIATSPKQIASIFKKLSWGARGLPDDFFETGLWLIE